MAAFLLGRKRKIRTICILGHSNEVVNYILDHPSQNPKFPFWRMAPLCGVSLLGCVLSC